MTYPRKRLRDAAREAMANAPQFVHLHEIRSWSQTLDTDALPAWGVGTPDETADAAAKEIIHRRIALAVTVKRTGGEDLEDNLDYDAAAIEAAVWPALLALNEIHVEPSATSVRFAGEGSRRIGTVEVRFACHVMTETPPPAEILGE